MDYTQSNSFVTDAGTTQRMHLAGQAVPTAVSDNDMNMLVWELMEIVKAGGQVGAPFDKAVSATYQKLLTALRAAGVFSTAAALDNTTKAATTAFVRAELLSLGNAAYAAIFGNSKTGSGYQRLPGGLILQWMPVTTTVFSNGFNFATLPIVYPTAALAAQISSAAQAGGSFGVDSFSPSQVRFTNTFSAVQGGNVLSIGY